MKKKLFTPTPRTVALFIYFFLFLSPFLVLLSLFRFDAISTYFYECVNDNVAVRVL